MGKNDPKFICWYTGWMIRPSSARKENVPEFAADDWGIESVSRKLIREFTIEQSLQIQSGEQREIIIPDMLSFTGQYHGCCEN